MIEINKPITIFNDYKVQFKSVVITNNLDKMVATIYYNILNVDNKVIQTKFIIYENTDFNIFWDNFNTGRFLYQEILKDTDIEIPETIETEFYN